MKNIYKAELMAVIIGILMLVLSLYRAPIFTGYVLGVNNTIYSEDMNLIIDSSQKYTLASPNETLNLKSFMISGEVMGNGRVEVLLDNGNGLQYLVYENIQQTQAASSNTVFSITGMAVDNQMEEKKGEWLVVQPKKIIKYEFFPLKEGEEIVSGEFYAECKETCNIPKGLFNSDSYDIILRLEQGTTVKLTGIKYTLYE